MTDGIERRDVLGHRYRAWRRPDDPERVWLDVFDRGGGHDGGRQSILLDPTLAAELAQFLAQTAGLTQPVPVDMGGKVWNPAASRWENPSPPCPRCSDDGTNVVWAQPSGLDAGRWACGHCGHEWQGDVGSPEPDREVRP